MTRLLLAWRAGDETALARLTPLVHKELQRIARGCMRGERARDSFQATALVHEAYLRLVDTQHVNWQNRAHFLAMAARLMRRILVTSRTRAVAWKLSRARVPPRMHPRAIRCSSLWTRGVCRASAVSSPARHAYMSRVTLPDDAAMKTF